MENELKEFETRMTQRQRERVNELKKIKSQRNKKIKTIQQQQSKKDQEKQKQSFDDQLMRIKEKV